MPAFWTLGAVAVLALGSADAASSLPTTLLCSRYAGEVREETIRPRTCSTIGPHDSMADGVVMKRLKWRGWGQATATAHGVIQPKTYDVIAVTARAYRRRKVCGSHYRYTRLRITLQDKSTVVRFPTECAA
jgi:hypothetical protein